MTGTLLVDRDVALEAGLAAAVVDTLLREDYAGLAGRVRATGAGMVLDWPGGPVMSSETWLNRLLIFWAGSAWAAVIAASLPPREATALPPIQSCFMVRE